jgi:hypothetical protein
MRELSSENLKRRDLLVDLGIGGKIMLKWLLVDIAQNITLLLPVESDCNHLSTYCNQVCKCYSNFSGLETDTAVICSPLYSHNFI